MKSSSLESILVVELEVNSRCNRSCSYCPVSVLAPPTAKMMTLAIFYRIIEQLVDIDYSGRLSYHFYNEPLLRRDLEKLISYAHSRLPRARSVVFTNGDLLSESRYETLVRAGVDQIVITSHSGKAHVPRDKQIVQFPADLELTNRGGTLTQLPSASSEEHRLPCFAPSEMLIITVVGDVLLCYEDACRRNVYGNVMSSNLRDIWLSPTFVQVRELLRAGQRRAASPSCQACTNRAHTQLGTSAYSEPFWDNLGLRPVDGL